MLKGMKLNHSISTQDGKKHQGFILELSIIIVCSFVIAFFGTAFHCYVSAVRSGVDLAPSYREVFLLFLSTVAIALLLGFTLLSEYSRPVLVFIFQHRVLIGILIIAICVLFNLSGSSIALWSNYIGGESFQGTVFGVPRQIRSDEWNVFTPFAFSQFWNGYDSVSEILRGAPTDVTLVYAQPCWSFSTLFRPFLWGYLLLGSVRGLAFFWTARMVCLFLVSIEMGLRITNKNAGASTAFAIFVSFAATVQWWFAVNGIAELLIFGQGLVLALDALLIETSPARRLAISVLMAWMAVGFILVIYPAWQVPLFWIFSSLGAGIAMERFQDGAVYKSKELVWPVLVCVLLVLLSIGAVFYPAIGTVETVMGTAYPGKRVESGGGGIQLLFTWVTGLFGFINAESPAFGNVCEAAGFTSLLPLGLMLGGLYTLFQAYNRRRVDLLVAFLLVIEAVLLVYVVIGLPGPAAKLTLLSHSTANRVGQVLGFADLILMLIVVSRTRQGIVLSKDRRVASWIFTVSFICASVITVWTKFVLQDWLRLLFTMALWLYIFAFVASMLCSLWSDKSFGILLLPISLIVAVSGFCVNPIQAGADALMASDAYAELRQLVELEPDADWVADNSILGQFCIASGAKCINSVNTYPVLNRWHRLDPDSKYEGVYNRYAYISVNPGDEAARFELIQNDAFSMYVTSDALKEIGVEYWLSTNGDLDKFDSGLKRYAKVGSFYVWSIAD